MRVTLFAAALVACAPTLAAQAVHGRLVAADSAPVAGAIVMLVDSAGVSSPRVLSTARGGYVVRAPHPGTYTLRVLRIGFPPFTSDPLTLAAGASLDRSLTLPEIPVVLNDIDVSGGNACDAGAAEGSATATLLGEVQKAFGSVELALADRTLRFEVEHFLRRTDKNSVLTAQDSARETMTSWPVHSLPAEVLRDRGFMMSWDSVDTAYLPLGIESGKVWFGPDPTTLFASAFLETHCYRVERDRHDATRVGLAFAPAKGRRLPDIRGTLWLDRRSFALHELTYEYVNLPRQFRDARNGATGGTMEFLRLPAGLWVVSDWDLRAPIEEVYNNAPIGIAGYLEEGGRIVSVHTTQGAVIY